MGIASFTVLQGVCHIILLPCSGQPSSSDGDGIITNNFMLEDLNWVAHGADILCLALNKATLRLEVLELCQGNVHSKRISLKACLSSLRADLH